MQESGVLSNNLRKTVRHLPGASLQSVAATNPTKSEPKDEKSEESKVATPREHGNEAFVPINFDMAVSIEGHDLQVVHVRPNH